MLIEPHTFCLFIGHTRTGSSAVGSIVDAHPNAIISHEFNVLRKIKTKNLDRETVVSRITENSLVLNNKGRWSGGATGEVYKHYIEGQVKSEGSVIYVLGDKKGGGNSRTLRCKPYTLIDIRKEKIKRVIERFEDRIGVQCKFVHVVRNPYDMIAAQILSGEKFSFRSIFQEALTCQLVNDLYPDRFLDIHHEYLISHPQINVFKLISFLGLKEDSVHLKASIEHLNFKPTCRRQQIEWKNGLQSKIQKQLIEEFECFGRYKR